MYAIMKTMCPLVITTMAVATYTLVHMIYSYILLVPMNQRVLNKQSKECNISGHK